MFSIVVQCWCKLKGQIGVEMEVFIGVNVVFLILFDMCKVVDFNMIMIGIYVLEKCGGKIGDW